MVAVKKPKKVNYLNNRDILKQIHLSKASYCSFIDPENDHQHDIILDSVDRINMRTVAEARRNRVDRIKKETGEVIDQKDIPNTDLVFRVMTKEHIPLAPPKKKKSAEKKRSIEDIMGWAEVETETPDEEQERLRKEMEEKGELTHVRCKFPPFFHYRIDENREPYIVGKSHWVGGMENGHFSQEHGQMTNRLAQMFIKLCERYATRSNWRGYTYNEEMRGQALLQLSQIGLQFDESKSQNPFAYYTAAITNSFTRVLNIEKKNQNIRDDILEANGMNPSWTRQYRDADKKFTNQTSSVITKIIPKKGQS